jgi:hypothetical protein
MARGDQQPSRTAAAAPSFFLNGQHRACSLLNCCIAYIMMVLSVLVGWAVTMAERYGLQIIRKNNTSGIK